MGLLREQLVLINKAISDRDDALIAAAALPFNLVVVRAIIIGLVNILSKAPCRHLFRQSLEPGEWFALEVP
jgi:hypothetical protein